jgi:hypothetical protein
MTFCEIGKLLSYATYKANVVCSSETKFLYYYIVIAIVVTVGQFQYFCTHAQKIEIDKGFFLQSICLLHVPYLTLPN